MFSFTISAVPALLLGKYAVWWLGLMLWAVEAIAYLTIDLRRHEARGKWWTGVFIGLFSLIYGPILLAYDFLSVSRLGKLMLVTQQMKPKGGT